MNIESRGKNKMNRRQKIIVSVTGIFLVLLALVGLTYAYFLTRIQGNEETKSISVTTANLLLEYGDGNNIITMSNILPGEPIDPKTFTVINKGNETVQGYKVYLENVQNMLELKDDLTYTLTCKSYKTTDTTVDFSTLTEDGTCTGASSTTFPSVMSVIATNDIAVGYTHHYTLQLSYPNQVYDQSIDMDKLVQAKVNIYDGRTKFLSTEIINNAKSSTNTKYVEPNMLGIEENTTVPGNNRSLEEEKVLSYTFDDLGTSYYYRGNVNDNYVNFADMCWRIVRIEGDGSIKLILEDRYTTCNDNETLLTSDVYTGNWSDDKTYAFGTNDINVKTSFLNYSGGLADSFKAFQTSKLSKSLDKLKIEEWCYDDTVIETSSSYNCDLNYDGENDSECIDEYYGSYGRIETNKPSLYCGGSKLTKFKDNTNMYVGTLTADEIVFSGLGDKHFLNNGYGTEQGTTMHWWLLSPSKYIEYGGVYYSFGVNFYEGGVVLNNDFVTTDEKYYSRPAITLKSDVLAITNSDTETHGQPGSQTNPYVIN